MRGLTVFQRWINRCDVRIEAKQIENFATSFAVPEGLAIRNEIVLREAKAMMRRNGIIPMIEVCEERAHPYRRATDEGVISTPGVEHYRAEVRHVSR